MNENILNPARFLTLGMVRAIVTAFQALVNVIIENAMARTARNILLLLVDHLEGNLTYYYFLNLTYIKFVVLKLALACKCSSKDYQIYFMRCHSDSYYHSNM
jgi:hypothetical protein